MICGILVPQPGIEPWATTVKAPSPNHWTTREFPPFSFDDVFLCCAEAFSFDVVSSFIFAFDFLAFGVRSPKTSKTDGIEATASVFFQVLHSSLSSILCSFLYVEWSGFILLHTTDFPNTIS